MSTDELTMKEYEPSQIWVGDVTNSFLNGYGDFLFKEFKKHKLLDKKGMSMFLTAAASCANLNDIDEVTPETDFSHQFFNFILTYERGGHRFLTNINERLLTKKEFTKIILMLLYQFNLTLQ